jgi:hypothetical protein
MKHTFVHDQSKPERAQAAGSKGVRYLVLRTEDGSFFQSLARLGPALQ